MEISGKEGDDKAGGWRWWGKKAVMTKTEETVV